MHGDSSELEFFTEAMLHITSSLELPAAIERTFPFFKRHFPIDALSLHQYMRDRHCLKLLFFITDQGFRYVERLVPIEHRDAIAELDAQTDPHRTYVFSCNEDETTVCGQHSRALSDMLPFAPRAYMVGILGLGKDVIGHMVMLGSDPYCFTSTHKRLFSLLLRPVSLAMINMLQYKRVLEFQNRLDAEKTRLSIENKLLRETNIMGFDSGLREVFGSICQLAGSDAPVLILGETGTGKELVADAIQRVSRRSDKVFLKVNCGAIPESLIDSALFGFEKGAFTGASSSRAGYFEQADGGTLFLDEVAELPPNAQVRLLRVLQDGVVQRLGSVSPVRVNVRIIAATNRELGSMLQHGQFREDLYYRLNVFPIHIPPLRERTVDIIPLLRHFASRTAERMGLPVPAVDPASLERLLAYSWPGNVRELKNLVERALIAEPFKALNIAAYLPQDPAWYLGERESGDYLQKLIDERISAVLAQETDRRRRGQREHYAEAAQSLPETIHSLSTLAEIDAEHIRRALRLSRGKISGPNGAAEILDLPASTLRKRMRKLDIPFKSGLSPGSAEQEKQRK